jgi:hypothetical protein
MLGSTIAEPRTSSPTENVTRSPERYVRFLVLALFLVVGISR